MQYPLLPLEFVKFWYITFPLVLLSYFASLNTAFIRLFSISLLFKTFFQPLKNEYREGLVGFSIGMGMFVKTVILFVAVVLFFLLSLVELLFITLFVMLPVLSFVLLFITI